MIKFSKPVSESVVMETLSRVGGILSNMIFVLSVVLLNENSLPAGSVKYA